MGAVLCWECNCIKLTHVLHLNSRSHVVQTVFVMTVKRIKRYTPKTRTIDQTIWVFISTHHRHLMSNIFLPVYSVEHEWHMLLLLCYKITEFTPGNKPLFLRSIVRSSTIIFIFPQKPLIKIYKNNKTTRIRIRGKKKTKKQSGILCSHFSATLTQHTIKLKNDTKFINRYFLDEGFG